MVVQCAPPTMLTLRPSGFRRIPLGTIHAKLQPTCICRGRRYVDGRVLAAMQKRRPNDKDETDPPRDWWWTTAAQGEFGVCSGHYQEQRRVCDRLWQRRGSSACFCRCAIAEAAPHLLFTSPPGSQR